MITFIINSEQHFSTMAGLAGIEKAAIYSSYNILLALGNMLTVDSNGAKFRFVLSLDCLKNRLAELSADIIFEECNDSKRMIQQDIDSAVSQLKINEEIIRKL